MIRRRVESGVNYSKVSAACFLSISLSRVLVLSFSRTLPFTDSYIGVDKERARDFSLSSLALAQSLSFSLTLSLFTCRHNIECLQIRQWWINSKRLLTPLDRCVWSLSGPLDIRWKEEALEKRMQQHSQIPSPMHADVYRSAPRAECNVIWEMCFIAPSPPPLSLYNSIDSICDYVCVCVYECIWVCVCVYVWFIEMTRRLPSNPILSTCDWLVYKNLQHKNPRRTTENNRERTKKKERKKKQKRNRQGKTTTTTTKRLFFQATQVKKVGLEK